MIDHFYARGYNFFIDQIIFLQVGANKNVPVNKNKSDLISVRFICFFCDGQYSFALFVCFI